MPKRHPPAPSRPSADAGDLLDKRPGSHDPGLLLFTNRHPAWRLLRMRHPVDDYIAAIGPMLKNSVSPEESSTPSLSVTTNPLPAASMVKPSTLSTT